MLAHFAADAVVIFHFGFILFAIFGGALVFYRPYWACLHLPACAWGVWIEVSHHRCPLTRLENLLRADAGEAGYGSGFVNHYLVPLIYPPGLLARQQLYLAAGLLGINLTLYAVAFIRQRKPKPLL
jgi:hypothetical protein